MIFNEQLQATNLEGINEGVNTYSVIVNQLADNLHDLSKVASNNGSREISNRVNEAEMKVREATAILEKILEDQD